ncbi:MAG TPA: MraY family glycosyltransferase [candidate division Zixibacteria bacterium]|nr:MraY family glycosyltransferase [candidate division Zixibacteria bacterium]
MTSFLIIFLIALLVSFSVTPAAIRLSKMWGVEAKPGGRRRHKMPVPKLGGLPVMIAFIAGIAAVYLIMPPSGDDALRLRGVVIGTLVVFTGGLIDDFRELPPWMQFLIQLAGAGIAISHIVFIEVFTNPISGSAVWIESFPLVLVITILWIVGVINTVNWLDGLDGLAAGVGTIAAMVFAWHSYRLGQDAVAAFPLVLAGALVGFLPYNFAPARIFLGTAGAYVLGYNLATLAILSPAKIATALLVLAVPILDGMWRVTDRIRTGRSPFYGDRGHLHFRLLDEQVPTKTIVVGYYALSLAFGLVAIFATGLAKLIILLILAVFVLFFLMWLSFRRGAG